MFRLRLTERLFAFSVSFHSFIYLLGTYQVISKQHKQSPYSHGASFLLEEGSMEACRQMLKMITFQMLFRVIKKIKVGNGIWE